MQNNNDIIITTTQELVIGYICKKLKDTELLNSH